MGFTIIFGLMSIPLMGYTLALIASGILSCTSTFLPQKLRLVPNNSNDKLLLTCFVLFSAFVFFGAVIFSTILQPEWSFIEATYFCAMTLMTVGFGDYAPTRDESKVFTVLYILVGLGVTATMIALLTRKLDENIRAQIV